MWEKYLGYIREMNAWKEKQKRLHAQLIKVKTTRYPSEI